MSIVGTFAVMYLLGYSLDNLSLMALTLSVGLRRRRRDRDAREHRAPHGDGQGADARRRSTGSREIGFTIVSMTLSLAAVFIPVLFMGGILGRLLHEFAVTIIGGDPGLGLRLADAHADAVQPLPRGRTQAENARAALPGDRARLRRRCSRVYERSLRWALRAPRVTMAVRRSRSSRHGVSVRRCMPKGFLPSEDTGQHLRVDRRPRRTSRSTHDRAQQQQAAEIVAQTPERRRVHVVVGARRLSGGDATPGASSSRLKPRDERPAGRRDHRRSCGRSSRSARHQASSCRTRRRSASAAASTKSLYQYTLQGADTDELYTAAPQLEDEAARRCPGCIDVTSDLQITQPAGQRRDRPRQGVGARRHRASRSRTRSTTPTARGRSPRSTRRPTSTG